MPHRVVAYFISWGVYARNYQPSDIPATKLTHLNYAFANIDDSGRVVLGDKYADVEKAYEGDIWDETKQPFRGALFQIMNKTRVQNPSLKVLLSVGGWTWSGKFSDAAKNDASRQIFAQSAFDLLTKYGFDGIDLDWEYPVEGGLDGNVHRPEDAANYVLLLNAIRKLIGPDKLLSIAAPASKAQASHLEMAGLSNVLDFVNVMTYDYRGTWSSQTGHMAPLYPSKKDPSLNVAGDASTSIKFFIAQGMPAQKINMGAALYGRGFAGVNSTDNGLFQKFSAQPPKGTWDDGSSGATGVYDYVDVEKKIKCGNFTRYFDTEAQAPYAYSSSEQILISYDDEDSIEAKCKFIKKEKLGGVMFWDMTGDHNAERSLIAEVGKHLYVHASESGSSEDKKHWYDKVKELI